MQLSEEAAFALAKDIQERVRAQPQLTSRYPILGFWTQQEVVRMQDGYATAQFPGQDWPSQEDIARYREKPSNDADDTTESGSEDEKERDLIAEIEASHNRLESLLAVEVEVSVLPPLPGEEREQTNFSHVEAMRKEADTLQQDIGTYLNQFLQLFQTNPELAMAYLAAAAQLSENLVDLHEALAPHMAPAAGMAHAPSPSR